MAVRNEEPLSVTLTGGGDYRFDVHFDEPGVPSLLVDERPPLGEGDGPNPSRLLAAAVGHCLSASLLFCLRKARIEPLTVRTVVEGTIMRNEQNRLRIGGLKVRIHPDVPPDQVGGMQRCLDLFEDFCIVTQSVRDGIDVDVAVEMEEEPVAP